MSARIDSITLVGLKSDQMRSLLGRRTLVKGDIGTGKSRIADAIRFCALGHVPAQGSAESATARLMHGNVMRVRLGLSDGRWIERALMRDGTRLRSSASASWLPADTGLTEASEAIRRLFGTTDAEASAMLDFRSILAATPSQRAAFIEPLLDATSMDAGDRERWVAALSVLRATNAQRIPDAVRTAEAAAAGMLETLDERARKAVLSAVASSAEALRTRGLADALTDAGTSKRAALEATRRKRAARAEIEDRRVAAEAPAQTLEQIDAARQERSDRLAVLGAMVAAAGRQVVERTKAETALRAADDALAALVAPGDVVARSDAMMAEAASLRAQARAIVDPPDVIIPALVEPDPGVMASAGARDVDADEIERCAPLLPVPPEPFVAKTVPVVSPAGVAMASAALADASKSPWPSVASVAARVRALPTSCPDCTQIADELDALARANGPNLAVLSAALTRARDDFDAARSMAARIEAENHAGLSAWREAHAAWDAARLEHRMREKNALDLRVRARAIRDAETARVGLVNAERRSAYTKAVAERTAAVDAATQKRSGLLRLADRAESAARDLIAKWTAASAAVAEARARVDGMDVTAPIDVDAAASESDALRAELAALEAQRQEVEGADARLRAMSSLAAEIESAESEERAWRAVEWALQRLREMDLAQRGAPLVDRMTRFLAAAGRREVPFLRAARGRCAFGWSAGGDEREVESLSGGETCLFVAALTAAIIALCKPEASCLLIDEAERVGSHLAALLAGCEAVQDAVGTIVVMTCNEDAVAPDGWARVSCSRDGSTMLEDGA